MTFLARILRFVGFLETAAKLDARAAAKVERARRAGLNAGELAEEAEREARNLRPPALHRIVTDAGWVSCSSERNALALASERRAEGWIVAVRQDAVGWWVVTWSGPP